ncbi:SIR2 family protein [Rhizobium sp. L245/93]|uniref:SIR2 family protein n=1 Tax=Rhizobium sp. L245/93 TaxID=2819998 RepID=UPI001ADC5E6D|nr:SIR2 family protein [Rhizobium sp. L245/93]MBO9170022.1 SIR2 family protein [Rhizobium sp. L245/93]
MRFTAYGPSIPDELLIARDQSKVVFFCGAGVSQARAKLDNFADLADKAMAILGAGRESSARKLLDAASTAKQIKGVGSLVATDRVFSLLERDFEVSDIHAAVSSVLAPLPGADLSAHRLILTLAGGLGENTRLVTTNFDLLFEDCDVDLPSIGPLSLPDLSRTDLHGIVHLHGRVTRDYSGSDADGFVLSSSDFGKAYLANGWATRFIQALLEKYSIVFLGYSADDPPVQYLLEALKGTPQSAGRMYAFQSGEDGAASALWEHKGVTAIPYSQADGHSALWRTLEAWAERAEDVDGWYDRILVGAAVGPQSLLPHERGQLIHIASTTEGARRLAHATVPASWLYVLDRRERYRTPPSGLDTENPVALDPFHLFGLDDDQAPEPETERQLIRSDRKIPSTARDILDISASDLRETSALNVSALRGPFRSASELHKRLDRLAQWFWNIAHQRDALTWAIRQASVHPRIADLISSALVQNQPRFDDETANGWRYRLRTWADARKEADLETYQIRQEAENSGWSQNLVRRLFAIRTPQLLIEEPSEAGTAKGRARAYSLRIEYPTPHEVPEIPDAFLGYAVSRACETLEYAKSLEGEVRRGEWVYLRSTYEAPGAPPLPDEQHGVAGLILYTQRLMAKLMAVDPKSARSEFARWPKDDDAIFARLRIWAAGQPTLLKEMEACAVFTELGDVDFWGNQQQRDLLMAIKDRWTRLSSRSRLRLEARLLSPSYPWPKNQQPRAAEYNAMAAIERIRWLNAHGVVFSFDVNKTIASFATALKTESVPVDVEAAVENYQSNVFSIGSDTNSASLQGVPNKEILKTLVELEGIDFNARVDRDPFRGLVSNQPLRALSALSLGRKQMNVPFAPWAKFLRDAEREKDDLDFICLIVGRVLQLNSDQLLIILYPVSGWLERLSRRLYVEAPAEFETLWMRCVSAAGRLSEPESARYPDESWLDKALNSPVGSLTQALFNDPTTMRLKRNAGFPNAWKEKAETLMTLPGDMKRQALVLASYQLTSWFHVDPTWTKRKLLPFQFDNGSDGDAFWDGFLWANHVPQKTLFHRMKKAITARVALQSNRQSTTDRLSEIILYIWLNWRSAKRRPLSNDDLRQLLVLGGEAFAGKILWHFEGTLKRGGVPDRILIEFFVKAWPLQKAMKTEDLTRRLVNFAIHAGDSFPVVLPLVLKRVVPTVHFDAYTLANHLKDGIAAKYPRELLELLVAILPIDTELWQYGVSTILDHLVADDRTRNDPRLRDLRRRSGLTTVLSVNDVGKR